MTNSERRISRQRPFLSPPGEARADWWILAQIARRLGHGEAFSWQHPQEIFCEHAALSGLENRGTRAFDISALADLNRQQYDELEPVRWPVVRHSVEAFKSWRENARFQLLPVEPALPVGITDSQYPLLLNTGRIRDQWHTMTRTGSVPGLMQHIAMPLLEIHPHDAHRYGIANAELVRIASSRGGMIARAVLSENQQPGSLFLPMHWSKQYARKGQINSLIAKVCDPHSGQPESKQTAVRLQRWQPAWQGEIFARDEIVFMDGIQWWRQAAPGRQHFLCAGDSDPKKWAETVSVGRDWQWQYADGHGEFYHLLALGERYADAGTLYGKSLASHQP